MSVVERIEASSPAPPLLLCCEHASQRLPERWSWPPEDRWLRGTHWAYDLGAAELTRELAGDLGCAAVLAGFSRLLIDANRPLGSDTLIRRQADERVIALNRDVGSEEESARVAYWRSYHDALGEAAARSTAPVMMAVHSFTDCYQGRRRDHIEVGVLFDHDEALAARVAHHLELSGLNVRLNEPYSGKQGLIYSVDRHATSHGKGAIELEVRQDRCVSREFRRSLLATLRGFEWSGL